MENEYPVRWHLRSWSQRLTLISGAGRTVPLEQWNKHNTDPYFTPYRSINYNGAEITL
jgi:hypothetical protein